MPDYQKDTPRQAALRREIETHAIWQYPPEERLQHNREWQSLYLLVFEFKNFLQKIEHRLQTQTPAPWPRTRKPCWTPATPAAASCEASLTP